MFGKNVKAFILTLALTNIFFWIKQYKNVITNNCSPKNKHTHLQNAYAFSSWSFIEHIFSI